MTGAAATRLWESAVEPARREAAKARQGDSVAKFRLTILAETLGAVRLSLIALVTREEDGVLGEITREWSGLMRISESGYRIPGPTPDGRTGKSKARSTGSGQGGQD